MCSSAAVASLWDRHWKGITGALATGHEAGTYSQVHTIDGDAPGIVKDSVLDRS